MQIGGGRLWFGAKLHSFHLRLGVVPNESCKTAFIPPDQHWKLVIGAAAGPLSDVLLAVVLVVTGKLFLIVMGLAILWTGFRISFQYGLPLTNTSETDVSFSTSCVAGLTIEARLEHCPGSICILLFLVKLHQWRSAPARCGNDSKSFDFLRISRTYETAPLWSRCAELHVRRGIQPKRHANGGDILTRRFTPALSL